MKADSTYIIVGLIIVLFLGFLLGKANVSIEKFEDMPGCNVCRKPKPCGCRRKAESQQQTKYVEIPKIVEVPETKYIEIPKIVEVPVPMPPPCKKCVDKECSPCPQPDPTKYVLKTSVPPCPPVPDMSRYMLKTECPSVPDMSKYVLKTSIPSCPPCIATCSKPCKIGDCPPCPRPRCPVVQCPEPKACPACPAVSCAPCSEPDIKCKASYEPSAAPRPMLASMASFGL